MKKATLMAVSVLLGAALFANGGKDNASQAGKTVLKLGIWPEATVTGDLEMHKRFVKDFAVSNPDVTVEPATYTYAVDTFVPLAESGNLPTVFETWFSEPEKLIGGKFVRDITAELKERGWDAKMNSSIRDILSRDGKIYGVPRDAYALGLMLNVALFREAGLVDKNGAPLYPKTWDELAVTAKKIKDKTGAAGICFLAMDNSGGWLFTNIAWGFGANFVVEKNGRLVAQIDTPEAIAAVQYVKDLKWKYDVMTEDPTNENWATGFGSIGTGAAAMYIAAQDAVSRPTQLFGLPVSDIGLAPVPAGPKGQYSLMGGTPYMFAANATHEQIVAALDYLVVMGKSPEVTDQALAGFDADARNRLNEGIPIVPTFPAWVDPAYLKAQDDVNNKYRNVDMRLFNDYYAKVSEKGNLRREEKGAQVLYGELTKVLQAVIVDRKADPAALMKAAQKNVQAQFDAKAGS